MRSTQLFSAGFAFVEIEQTVRNVESLEIPFDSDCSKFGTDIVNELSESIDVRSPSMVSLGFLRESGTSPPYMSVRSVTLLRGCTVAQPVEDKIAWTPVVKR